jgi:hypothetical protein
MMTLYNNTGCPAGDYPEIVAATSAGSGNLVAYDYVVISIT